MTEMFHDTEKCKVIFDDFLMGGKNTEDGDHTLIMNNTLFTGFEQSIEWGMI